MDQIEFNLVEGFLNEEPGLLLLSIECRINEKLVIEWKDLPVDILELKDSALKSGNYCIWTCTCGIPECGGVDSKGITIKHTDKKIIWTNLAFPIKNVDEYNFDKDHYVNSVDKIWKEFKRKYFELKHQNRKFEICPDLRLTEILEEINK